MFGLGKQVHGHPVRVRGAVADDENFRRAGDHIDTHPPEHLALGGGDIDVARPDDLVHRRHGGRTVRQRRHRLRAADGEHPVHPGDRRRGQHQVVELATRGGHHHDDFIDAGNPRRQGVHQHGRGIARLPPGHIDPDALHGRDLLPQQVARVIAILPAFLALVLVVGTDARRGLLQRIALIVVDARQGVGEPRGRHFQIRGPRRLKPVETARVFKQGLVAAPGHIGKNCRYRRIDLAVQLLVPGGEFGQPGVELGVSRVKPPHHRSPPPPRPDPR